jgi:hypothetical protein
VECGERRRDAAKGPFKHERMRENVCARVCLLERSCARDGNGSAARPLKARPAAPAPATAATVLRRWAGAPAGGQLRRAARAGRSLVV